MTCDEPVYRRVNFKYVMERDDDGEPIETVDWWYVDEEEEPKDD